MRTEMKVALNWMMYCAHYVTLTTKEEDLLEWFRLTVAHTVRVRTDMRRKMAGRHPEVSWIDIEAAA